MFHFIRNRSETERTVSKWHWPASLSCQGLCGLLKRGTVHSVPTKPKSLPDGGFARVFDCWCPCQAHGACARIWQSEWDLVLVTPADASLLLTISCQDELRRIACAKRFQGIFHQVLTLLQYESECSELFFYLDFDSLYLGLVLLGKMDAV